MNPDNQNNLSQRKQREQAPKSEFMRDEKTSDAAKNVAEWIGNRIAKVFEREGRGAIAFDYGIWILYDFPHAFDENSDEEQPGKRYFAPEN